MEFPVGAGNRGLLESHSYDVGPGIGPDRLIGRDAERCADEQLGMAGRIQLDLAAAVYIGVEGIDGHRLDAVRDRERGRQCHVALAIGRAGQLERARPAPGAELGDGDGRSYAAG